MLNSSELYDLVKRARRASFTRDADEVNRTLNHFEEVFFEMCIEKQKEEEEEECRNLLKEN